MSFLTRVLTPKKLLLFSILYSIFFIYGLWDRKPDIDDAWLGEHAYYLVKDGYVHSELMHGLKSEGERLVIHHKLFTLQGALFIKLFGFSLYTLKSISLIYFLVFIGLFYFYSVKHKRLFQPEHFLFALILILVSPISYKYAFVYRPEVMMMTIGFAGYILLENFLESKKTKNNRLLLVGFLFGLTMAAHLNGLILVISGLLLLIRNKRFSGLYAYVIGAIVGFSPYFYDMTRWSDFKLWWLQIHDNPALDSLSGMPVVLKPFVNLLKEHIHYFHDPEIIVFSVLLIVSLLIGFGFLFRNHTNLLRFTFFIAVLTGILAPHKLIQYLLINFPYFILLITLVFKNLGSLKPKFGNWTVNLSPPVIQKIFVSFFLVFILVSSYANSRLAISKFNLGANRKLTRKYTEGNTTKMNIIAPMPFIFNEIKNYHRIQGEVCYKELQKTDPSIVGAGFLKKASYFNVGLIMISPYYMSLLKIDQYRQGDIVANYKVIDKTSQLIVFKQLTDLSSF